MVEEKDGKMVVTYQFLNDTDIGNTLVKLRNCDDFPVKTGYRVGVFCNRLLLETAKARDKFGSLVRKYAKLDESGRPLGVDKNKLEFENLDSEAQYNSEFDVLLGESFEIDLFKINPDHLKPAKLTSGELAKFGPFIDL